MRTSAATIAFAIAFAFVGIAGSWGGASSSIVEPRTVHASLNVSGSLADDLTKVCGCLESFGPPAPVLDPKVLPGDVSLEDNTKCDSTACPSPNGCCQPCFDCFGWQLFIALNWPAKSAGQPDPAKPFGEPRDYSDAVWQTYKSAFEIFGDTQPEAWGVNKPHELQLNNAVIRDTLLKSDMQSDHNWLTDQDGKMVRYEIRVNRDEFEYILKNDLWHQEGIFNAVNGPGITLPAGSMEVKAAWRIIPPARRAYFEESYKVAHARVYDSASQSWKDQDVALVGLHIIKKTPHSPQWVWATFEHQDNVPVQGESGEGKQWNFFNPQLFKTEPDYKPNFNSPPSRTTPPDKPVQVLRVKQASDDAAVRGINDAMHRLIAARFPHSVWRNYDLISVQWPRVPAKPDPTSQKVLPSGQPRPRVLANTAMETYQQVKYGGGGLGMSPGADYDQGPEVGVAPEDLGKSSCIACHRISAITPAFANHPTDGKQWRTDYSTLFFKAGLKKPDTKTPKAQPKRPVTRADP